MQSQNDKIKAVKHLLAKCDLSLSLHISIRHNTKENKKSEKRTQGVLKEVLPYKKKKNSGVFDDRWLHISTDFSIKHAKAKVQEFFHK